MGITVSFLGIGKVTFSVPHNINRAIQRISIAYNAEEMDQAELEDREPDLLPHFSVHNLRHTFCTRLCESTNDVKFIQQVMGHADFSTTMDIYTHITQENMQEKAKNISVNMKLMLKRKANLHFYKQIRLSYCFIRFRRVSRKSCRKVVVTRFFVVNDLFSTALLLPEYCHPASEDLSLPVRHTRTLRKSAYPRNQSPSSSSTAGL